MEQRQSRRFGYLALSWVCYHYHFGDDDDGIRALRPRPRPQRHHPEVGWVVVQRGQTRTTLSSKASHPHPVLDFRFPPLLPLPEEFEYKESVSPRSSSKGSARRPCSSSGRARGMRLMAGLYGSARSSLDHVEVGSRLAGKLSDEETERRQDMREPNAI